MQVRTLDGQESRPKGPATGDERPNHPDGGTATRPTENLIVNRQLVALIATDGAQDRANPPPRSHPPFIRTARADPASREASRETTRRECRLDELPMARHWAASLMYDRWTGTSAPRPVSQTRHRTPPRHRTSPGRREWNLLWLWYQSPVCGTPVRRQRLRVLDPKPERRPAAGLPPAPAWVHSKPATASSAGRCGRTYRSHHRHPARCVLPASHRA
jgi:hypothetical protein